MSKVADFAGDLLGGASKVAGGIFGAAGTSKGTNKTKLPPPTEEEQTVTKALVDSVLEQFAVLERQAELQRQLFDTIPGLFGEARSAADAFSTDFQGGPLSESEKAAIDTSVENALRLGEQDIARFRDEGLKQIRDTLAPARGLLTTDSPILNEAADVVRESQLQQGQLVRALRGQGAEAEFNRLFERDKLRAALQQSAFQNRLQLASGTSGIGLGLNPGTSIAGALGVLQQPRLAQGKVSVSNTASPVDTIGSIAQTGAALAAAFGFCWVAAALYGWHTPAWWAARNWIAEGWQGRTADAFRWAYRRYGERAAVLVTRSRLARALARPVFAWAVRRGTHG